MHVKISEEAEADLHNIEIYIKPKNPAAYERMVGAIFGSIYQLETFPLLGRNGREAETRELSVPRTPYVVVYRIPDQLHIKILRILHGRQQWPPGA